MKINTHILRFTSTVTLVLLFPLLLVFCATQQQGKNANPGLQEVKDKTLIPEGISVQPATGTIYLSSLHQNKIVAVDENGVTKDVIINGQDGFMWGLGMKFSKDGKILWACSADGKGKTALFEINHASRKITRQYTHDSARFFNDLVILDDGIIFITDTEKGAVFLLQNDTFQMFVKDEKLKWANGITATPSGKLLFVASGRYGLMKIDVATRSITSATNEQRTDYAIDGLVMHNNTLHAAIGWPQDSVHQHRIIRYHLDGQFNFISADTLAIKQPWLNTPTTLAVHNNRLFALATTNLGIYNRHQQQTTKIMDSLQHPLVYIFELPQPK